VYTYATCSWHAVCLLQVLAGLKGGSKIAVPDESKEAASMGEKQKHTEPDKVHAHCCSPSLHISVYTPWSMLTHMHACTL
jgi:hypothetical protein